MNKNRRFSLYLAALISSLTLLSGCVSNYMPAPPAQSDPAVVQMAEAANSVSHSMVTLEGIRKAENPHYQKQLPYAKSFDLDRLASIDWTGPIGPLVQKLAKATNYHYRVLGNPPPIPIIIALHTQNQPLGEILRNTDYQAGTHAFIKINVKNRVIELRYARS